MALFPSGSSHPKSGIQCICIKDIKGLFFFTTDLCKELMLAGESNDSYKRLNTAPDKRSTLNSAFHQEGANMLASIHQ